MAIVEEGSGEAPQLEDGLYELTVVSAVTGIREGPDKFNPEIVDAPIVHINTQIGDKLDEEGNPIILRSTMNLKFSRPGTYQPSTLFLFAEAFGVAPPKGTPFDTDWLVGKKAQGMVRTEKEGAWPKVVVESLIPIKGKAQKSPPAAQEARTPPEGVKVDEEVVSAWWKARLGEGFDRKAIIDLCKEMFEGRLPGELNAHELGGLTDQLNMTA